MKASCLIMGAMLALVALVLAMGADQLDRLDELRGYKKEEYRWAPAFAFMGLGVLSFLLGLLLP